MIGSDAQNITFARFAKDGLDLSGAIDAVRRNKGERHLRGERPRNHPARDLGLRCKAYIVWHIRRLQTCGIVHPFLGQIKRPVDEGMAVWAKNQPGMGSFYRSQHELFFIFAKAGAAPRNNIQLGRFGRSRSNVWTYPSAASLARTAEEGNPLAMHPTVKPLALICDILLDASVRGDIVVDPFAGSGTTLIAAEKLGRKARCMELDPAYCDTIIRRWQHWTGETAVRITDGVSFDALSAKAAGGDL